MKGYDSWTIITVKDGPGMLPDTVCSLLKRVACELYLTKKSNARQTHDSVVVDVETDGELCRVGARSGLLFKSLVKDGARGEYRVNFLLNENDLEYGAEILRDMGVYLTGVETMPDNIPKQLLEFMDLRSGRVRLN